MSTQPTDESLLHRVAAWSLVIVVPVVSFFVLCFVEYGEATITLGGAGELVDESTNETVHTPNFSLMARLVRGYAAIPGHGFTQRRLQEFEARHEEDFDLVVFGSSHAYRGVDPRIFEARGHEIFNLGTTGQTPEATHALVQDLGEHLGDSTVLIEVAPFQLQSGSESALTARDLALNRPPSWSSMRLALETEDFDTVRLVASYMVAPRPKLERPEDGLPLDVVARCFYVAGGYCEWREVGSPRQVFGGYDFAPDPSALDDLRAVIELVRGNGGEVVFFIAPLPRQTIAGAKHFEEGIDAVEALTGELDVPLLNFCDDRHLRVLNLRHPEHFYDADHLNQTGVALFNPRLIDELERVGALSR